MKVIKFGQNAYWHIDDGKGFALCQTVGNGEVVRAEIAEPWKERVCRKCWKKYEQEHGRPTLGQMIASEEQAFGLDCIGGRCEV